jgi:hypothetical protein
MPEDISFALLLLREPTARIAIQKVSVAHSEEVHDEQLPIPRSTALANELA